MSLLTMNRVTAGYQKGIEILDGISISVAEGSITGVIGLNGAGKSTLFKTTLNFLPPSDGEIRFDGSSLVGIAPYNMIDHGLWLIPQENGLFPQMSVEDNFLLPLRHLDRTTARSRMMSALERFPELRDRLSSLAGSLSGGQQKLLEIAKATAIAPRLLMVDEPSIGLSPAYVDQAYESFSRLRDAGTTVMLVDHEVERVIDIADYVYVLGIGKIVEEGRPDDMQGDVAEIVRRWMLTE